MFSHKVDDETELRLPLPHHAAELYGVVLENLDELKLWMPWATDDYSLASTQDYVKRNLQDLTDNQGFGLSVVQSGKIAGQIGFHHVDSTSQSAHIGYWLAKEVQGKGLITKCCRVLINYAFAELGLNRIQINCNVHNAKSRAVPERLHFQLEGIHRETELLNGKLGDMAIYAMLKKEWKQ